MAVAQAILPLPSLFVTCRVTGYTCESHRSRKFFYTRFTGTRKLRTRSARDLFYPTKSLLEWSNSRSVQARARLGGDGDVDLNGDIIAEDFYSVLGLTCDATAEEIKKAYYSCMKACHPDLSGNHPESTDFCMFVNEIYEVLSDPEQRMVYDEINGYSLTSKNPFLDRSQERDHVFVDEFTCIGCKNCANTAPDTFEIEEEFGRARVYCQIGDGAAAEEALQTCPVDCIYWVSAGQLTLLEDEMRRVERVNVGMMLSGMGYQSPDVFSQASWRWEKRQAKALERARIRMMKEKGNSSTGPWWQGKWTQPGGDDDIRPDDMGARERAAKTAAASRRWREYSRQGADRRGFRILPSQSESENEKKERKTPAVK